MIGAKGKSNFRSERPDLANLTGGATVQGGVYELDTLANNAATVDDDTALDNVVGTTATGHTRSPVVVSEQIVPTGARGIFITQGPIKVLCNGAVVKGDPLMAVSGQTYLQTATGTNRVVGTALAAQASGTGLVSCLFWGGRAVPVV